MRAIFAGAMCGWLAAAGASSHGADPRPNILWITAEDMCPNLGCYGDPDAITPQLDRLARQGVRYTQAFSVAPVCAPARSCLISGMYPSTLGTHQMRSQIAMAEAVRCFTEYLRAAGYYCTNNAKEDYNFITPQAAWDESSRTAHWRNRRPGQPFFAVFNIERSHQSHYGRYDPASPQRRKLIPRLQAQELRDRSRIGVPPFYPDLPAVRETWAQYHESITQMDYEAGDRLAELDQAGLAEQTIVFFFGDNGMGIPGGKRRLWAEGWHVPLIIRFPASYQHLAPAGPGSVCDRLVSFEDFAATVLSLAGVKVPGHMQGVAFLGPQAGPPRQYVYAIRDRVDYSYELCRAVRDARFHYIRNFLPHRGWEEDLYSWLCAPAMMAQWKQLAEKEKLTGRQAYPFSPRKPVEELYDTQADPYQLRNLAEDPNYQPVLQRLRAECQSWMIRTHDLGLLPEYEMHRRAAGSTPYAIGSDPRKNPVQRLLQAAEVANRMDPADLPRLRELLKDQDAAVRWWGALGLVGLGPRAAPAADQLLAALKDSAPDVRIAAAEALCQLGRQEAALPVLIAALEDESGLVRLAALHVLDRIGPKAAPAIPQLAKARTPSEPAWNVWNVDTAIDILYDKFGHPELRKVELFKPVDIKATRPPVQTAPAAP
ncbi:MAG: sulfatase-like hydrolase/transferase [Thermoguttaceae bacterium]